MQAQARYVKLNWLEYLGGGPGRVRFARINNCSAEVEDINNLVSNAVAQV